MPVPTKCFNIVRGKVLRATALDECGQIYVGSPPAAEVVVSDGVISVALTAEIEEGDEIRDRNWNGRMCVSDKAPNEFVRWTVEATFCNVDANLVSLMTGLPVELDDESEVVGFRTRSGVIESKLALEMWSGVTPVDCGPGATVTYGYTLLPFLTGGTMGDLTVENGRADFVVNGAYTQDGAGWGVGPYDVVLAGGVPAPLAVPIQTTEHHLLRLTNVPPPDAACEALTLEEAGGTRPVS